MFQDWLGYSTINAAKINHKLRMLENYWLQ